MVSTQSLDRVLGSVDIACIIIQMHHKKFWNNLDWISNSHAQTQCQSCKTIMMMLILSLMRLGRMHLLACRQISRCWMLLRHSFSKMHINALQGIQRIRGWHSLDRLRSHDYWGFIYLSWTNFHTVQTPASAAMCDHAGVSYQIFNGLLYPSAPRSPCWTCSTRCLSCFQTVLMRRAHQVAASKLSEWCAGTCPPLHPELCGLAHCRSEMEPCQIRCRSHTYWATPCWSKWILLSSSNLVSHKWPIYGMAYI